MTDFRCDRCGAMAYDSRTGYLSGCQHWPPDQKCVNCHKPEPFTPQFGFCDGCEGAGKPMRLRDD